MSETRDSGFGLRDEVSEFMIKQKKKTINLMDINI